jgi:DNA-binding transcriptional ArsR family regulator
MPRAATTADVFNAIAESRRRDLIDVLARSGPRPVTELVGVLDLPQPAVSKHLAVLRKVGIVAVARRGRERVYSLNAEELKPVHDWIKSYERFWTRHLDSIKERAERRAREQRSAGVKPTKHQEK